MRARLHFATLLLISCASFAHAQQSQDLEIGSLFFVPELRRIDVIFSAPIENTKANLALDNVTVTSKPEVKVATIAVPPGFSRRLRIEYIGDLPVGTAVTVAFKAVRHRSGQQVVIAENLSRTEVVEPLATRLNRVRQAFRETPKTSREKSIFASGFMVSASEGSEGGADIALNGLLQGLENTTSFLSIRKATQEGADHRNFEGGVRHRTPILFGGSRRLLESMQPGATAEQIADAQLALQRRWISGAVFDLAAKLEGEATDFNVSNFVGETAFQLRTVVRAFAGRKGFWRGYLVPVAIEGGQSLRAGDQAGATPSEVEWIARYKAGAGMTIFFEDPGSMLPLRRAEIDLSAVMRNLFFQESMYNEITRMADQTGKGVRAYGQADLKLFVGESDVARWGVKLTYNRGSLPPVFAKVKSFQFGFLFETRN